MKHQRNAPKTRRLREAGDEAGPHQGGSLRYMYGESISEAQAQATQTKPLGSWLCVKAPALQAQRDMLFEKYLRAFDQYERWKANAVPVYCTNYGKEDYKPLKMDAILKRHLDELSEQLRTYDDRINAARTTGPLLY